MCSCYNNKSSTVSNYYNNSRINNRDRPARDFERELMRIRKLTETEMASEGELTAGFTYASNYYVYGTAHSGTSFAVL